MKTIALAIGLGIVLIIVAAFFAVTVIHIIDKWREK
jgi:hypothetical protein